MILNIAYKFGDIRSSNPGDYEVINARRAALVAIMSDNCHPSSCLDKLLVWTGHYSYSFHIQINFHEAQILARAHKSQIDEQ